MAAGLKTIIALSFVRLRPLPLPPPFSLAARLTMPLLCFTLSAPVHLPNHG
jgi:hypothetical protein